MRAFKSINLMTVKPAEFDSITHRKLLFLYRNKHIDYKQMAAVWDDLKKGQALTATFSTLLAQSGFESSEVLKIERDEILQDLLGQEVTQDRVKAFSQFVEFLHSRTDQEKNDYAFITSKLTGKYHVPHHFAQMSFQPADWMNDWAWQVSPTDKQIMATMKHWLNTCTYVSLNTFYLPLRRSDKVSRYLAVGVDLDIYKIPALIGKKPQEVVAMLKTCIFGQKVRHPHAITTCNGIQLIYLLDGGEFKSKEQFQEIIKLRAAIVSKFGEIFEDYGVDMGAFLPTQIFRAAGSQHRKTGVIAQTSYFLNEIPHIREFAEEIGADEAVESTASNNGPSEKKKLPAKHRKAIFNAKQEIRRTALAELSGFVMNHMGILVPIRGHKFDGSGEYDFWTRCDALLADLIRLATIRKDNPAGTRRRARIAFVASVLAHLRFNPQEAREFVYGVSYVFTEPKGEDIIEQKVQEGKEYSELLAKVMRIPNTQTIISKWLQGITDQESSQLITLTTVNENLRRERIAKKIKRGSGTPERYHELRAKEKQDRQIEAAQMRGAGMSVKQISETMGVAERTVNRWFEEMKRWPKGE